MKKAVFALCVASLFFYLGRQNSSTSHAFMRKVSDSVPKSRLQPQIRTADGKNQSVQITSNSAPIALNDRLLTEQDSTLFATLYSAEFKQNFKSSLYTLKTRLLLPLPNPHHAEDDFQKEVTSRMGILKSIQQASTENDNEVKDLLFAVLDKPQPWILQREAIHALVTKNDLSTAEQSRAMKNLDPRSRNTASLSDKEILERTVEGEE